MGVRDPCSGGFAPAGHFLTGADDRQEIAGLEAGTSHQGAVDVGAGQQLLGVVWFHAPPILDDHPLGRRFADLRVVISGAGAAGVAITNTLIAAGVDGANVIICDSRGIIHAERGDKVLLVQPSRRLIDETFDELKS